MNICRAFLGFLSTSISLPPGKASARARPTSRALHPRERYAEREVLMSNRSSYLILSYLGCRARSFPSLYITSRAALAASVFGPHDCLGSDPVRLQMGRRRGGHGLPIRRRTPAEDASASELWFDSWFDIRTYEDLVTEEEGDGELFGIWPRQHMRAAPLVVIHLDTLAYVAAERLWPPCAPRLQVRPGCVELVASMKEVVQLALLCADTYVPEPPYCTWGYV